MAALKDKVENVLQEGRLLVIGAQVLLGFGYRSVFEDGFDALPAHARALKPVALGLMCLTVLLLLTPGAFHRIAEQGQDTHRVHHVASRLLDLALLPFALALGLELFVVGEKVLGFAGGWALGGGGALVALSLWYGLERVQRRRRRPHIEQERAMAQRKGESGEKPTPITTKISHALMETRTVLPGAQALLGFQLATMLTGSFDRLPATSKHVHLASLALVALSVVLLMLPAAYHRMVERGEETEHFYQVATRTMLLATLPLGLGMAGDLYVVVRKVAGSQPLALGVAVGMLVLAYGLWFGVPLVARAPAPAAPRTPARPPARHLSASPRSRPGPLLG